MNPHKMTSTPSQLGEFPRNHIRPQELVIEAPSHHLILEPHYRGQFPDNVIIDTEVLPVGRGVEKEAHSGVKVY